MVGPSPTDRGKRGLLTEGGGGPLGALLAPANAHDSTLIRGIIEAVVADHPAEVDEHLCPGKGFDTPAAEQAVAAAGYAPHIRRIGEEARPCDRAKGHKPRRWVVGRAIGWLNRCRAILVRYDKTGENDLGLTPLACALLGWRKLCQLHNAPVLG